MVALILIIAFILGAVIGSFLNVVIFRLKISSKNGSASLDISGRSKCPYCGKELTFFELIPLVSYLALSGRCSKCRKTISPQYPVVELLSGFILSGLVFYFGFANIYTYLIALILLLLLVIAFYDLENMIIPDVVLYPLYALIIVYDIIRIVKGDTGILDLGLGLVLGGGLFLVLVLVSKEKWMGWGDVKLGFALGLFLGIAKTLVALMSAFIAGALVSLVLIWLKDKELKDEIPFGPFLVLGAIVAVFIGTKIIEWYLSGI